MFEESLNMRRRLRTVSASAPIISGKPATGYWRHGGRPIRGCQSAGHGTIVRLHVG